MSLVAPGVLPRTASNCKHRNPLLRPKVLPLISFTGYEETRMESQGDPDRDICHRPCVRFLGDG
jgi:hypothetical protein